MLYSWYCISETMRIPNIGQRKTNLKTTMNAMKTTVGIKSNVREENKNKEKERKSMESSLSQFSIIWSQGHQESAFRNQFRDS